MKDVPKDVPKRCLYNEIRKMALEGKKIYWDERICEDKGLLEVRGRGKGTRYVLSVTIK